MNKSQKNLIIACDGEAASGKSTGAKLISKKYNLLLVNSGLIYRYASMLVLENKPKKIVPYVQKKISKISYRSLIKKKLHTQAISEYVGILSQNKKIRDIVNKFQRKIIKKNKRICVEGRDIASKILKKNPKYDLAFYFKCKISVASYRRWLDLNKKVPLKIVKTSLKKRTQIDKKRKHSPLIKVKDAILIRSDKLTKKQVVEKMSKKIDKHLEKKYKLLIK
tara:strand:- start:2113 stop:2778 length:666 start_codon:yes stop_codon:yes gene_type:complete